MNRLTSQIICDILTQQMVMPANSVWIRNQNRKIPADDGLYIVVGMVSATPWASNCYMVTETIDALPVQRQISNVQVLENIQIDIFSRSNAALIRNWEIVAALQSFYAQQQQEANYFKIMRLPHSFIDTASPEGSSELNRYSLIVSCLVWYIKDAAINQTVGADGYDSLGDYFDEFSTRADDETTIGTDTPLLEFELTPGTPPPP